MSLSESEYLDALQKKLSVELPLAERKIRKDFKKLEAALVDIQNEKRVVQAEIESLLKAGQESKKTSKCLLDMSHILWRGIEKHLQGHEFVLHNTCLSSADIEKAVTGGSATKKLKLLGEKVVTVLLMNYYLNADDLWKFLHTNSLDLQMFAGANWWCLYQRGQLEDISDFYENVNFKHPDDIAAFNDKSIKTSNKWLLFRGHNFIFDSTEISTAEKYELFWEAAVSFLTKFGTYLLCISFEFDDKFPMNIPIQNFCTDLLRVIPKLRYFCWYRSTYIEEGESTTILAKTNRRTVEPFFAIRGDFAQLRGMAWFESLRGNCVGIKIENGRLAFVQGPDSEYWHATKELIVNHVEKCHFYMLRADFSNLQNINKLVLEAISKSYGWRCLSLLIKFPKATEIVLSTETFSSWNPNGINMNIQENRFPKVTKLTVAITESMPLALDILPTVLPSLHQLYMVQKVDSPCLENLLKEWHRAGKFNGHNIDVYRLLAENRSLKESNIWNEIGNLNQFCIQRIVELSGVKQRITENRELLLYYIKKSEIYTRHEDGSIRFEHISF